MRDFEQHKGESRSGANAVAADRQSARERLDEVAALLAVGLRRLRAGQSSRLSQVSENSCVDFAAHQSGGAVVTSATENTLQ
jgi:hypothetical protein